MIYNDEDRRQHRRQAVQVAALAVIQDGVERLHATIVDASASGARLVVRDAAKLPSSFYLLIPEHRIQPCRVVWRKGQAAGVSYPEV